MPLREAGIKGGQGGSRTGRSPVPDVSSAVFSEAEQDALKDDCACLSTLGRVWPCTMS